MAQAPTIMSPSGSVMLHRKPRTIILCFDGTSNEYGTHNTNVVKFYSLLKKDRTDEQICYYQAGLGTYFKPGVVSPLFRRFAAILDQALAWYLSTHVMDGYKFLMQNYIAGDKVCLFGFSRGAYTARALAGMIHKVGLLLKDNEAQLPFAYKVYAAEDPDASQLAAGFKRTFCRAVPIEFIGVWDTVSSVGLFARKTLPFVTTNTTIKTFRQALALDERRAKFRANYYHRPVQNVTPTQSRAATFVKDAKKRLHKLKGGRSLRISDKILKDLPVVDLADDSIFTTDAKDVWFIGGHGDVGGGVSADGDDFALSDVPLRWMVRQAIRAQCGIQFENTALSLLNIPLSVANIFQTVPASGGGQQRTLHDFMRRSMSTTATDDDSSVDDIVVEGPDIERNVREIEQPIYDALSDHKSWWLLEIIPTKYTWQRTTTNEWVSEWSMHLGEGRGIPGDPLFHESVKRRMENEKIKYKPRARWTGNVTWVD